MRAVVPAFLIIGCAFVFTAAGCSGTGGDTTTDAGTDTDAGTPVQKKIGEACTADAQCAGTNAKCDTRLPGGYCMLTGCTTVGSECGGAGTVCVEGGLCLAACDSNLACGRADYECEVDHSCWYPKYFAVNPGKAATGAACATGADCESDACIPETNADKPTGYKGGYCSGGCGTNDDCASGDTCYRGACRKTCSAGTDCRDGYTCLNAVCVRDPAKFEIGKACADDAACGGAICLDASTNAPGFPGGYCTLANDCDANTGKGCGPNAECVSVEESGKPSYCLKKCAADADCREGYACDQSWGTGLCLIKPVAPGKVRLDDACTTDAACDIEAGAGGTCFKGENFPGGQCVAANCQPSDLQGDPCVAAGGVCLTVGDSVVGFCFHRCASDEDCRENQTCDTRTNSCH